jgi:hypothetical protein
MAKTIWILVVGIVVGVGVDRTLLYGLIPARPAQQEEKKQPQQGKQQAKGEGKGDALPTMESLPEEVAKLKALVPSNSHIMMDVQWHWNNLWFAAQAKNWPLAQYYFNETRGHIQWLIKKAGPVMRSAGPEREEVNIQGIFDGVDTSSLADVKTAIAMKDPEKFAASYKIMLESCYACHKSVGRPYIRPMIPKQQVQAMVNMDPNATWPQ